MYSRKYYSWINGVDSAFCSKCRGYSYFWLSSFSSAIGFHFLCSLHWILRASKCSHINVLEFKGFQIYQPEPSFCSCIQEATSGIDLNYIILHVTLLWDFFLWQPILFNQFHRKGLAILPNWQLLKRAFFLQQSSRRIKLLLLWSSDADWPK